jgi:hypothetical protein
MNFIRPLKDFKKTNDSNYGLEGIGYFYNVEETFELQILSGYTEEESRGKKYKADWSKIKVMPGDVISVAKKSTYLYPKDLDGFVECKPLEREYSSIWNKMVTDKKINKIGKTSTGSRPLTMEERSEISLRRGI